MWNFISKLSQLVIMMLILLSIISATLAMPYEFGRGVIVGPQNDGRSLRRDLVSQPAQHLFYGHEGLPHDELIVSSTIEQQYNPYYQQVELSGPPSYEPLPYNNLQQQPISYQYQNVISSPQNYPQAYSYNQDEQIKVVELTGDITDPSSITAIKEHILGGQAENVHQSQEHFEHPQNPQSSQDQDFIPQQQQQITPNNPIDYYEHQNNNNEYVDYTDQAFVPQQQQEQIIPNEPMDYYEQENANTEHVDYPEQAINPQQEQVIPNNPLDYEQENANSENVDYTDQAFTPHQQQQQQVIPNNPMDYFEQAQHFEPSQIPQHENISSEMPSMADDETKEFNNGENPQEINQPHDSQQVILPHDDTSTLNDEESMINYAPIPTQDLGDEEDCIDCGNSIVPLQEAIKENYDDSENPVDKVRGYEPIMQLRRSFIQQPNVAYSYQNLNLNPYGKFSEQRLPEMGFIFGPTILRVQQPHLILSELRHFKIQLDHSPIMNALFSPETVPIPPPVPWPSNFNAQRYLPPRDFFKTPKMPVKQETQPRQQMLQSDEPLNQNDEQTSKDDDESQQTHRRAMTQNSKGNSIEQSIHDSIAKNSGLFGSAFQFNFPAMPNFDDLLKNELEKIKSQPKSGSSLVQIGNGNTNINEVTQTDKNGKTLHVASMQMQMNDEEEEEDAKWASKLEVMNQIKEPTTIEPIITTTDANFLTTTVESTDFSTTEIVTTEKSNKSEETTLIPETTTFDLQTSTDGSFLTTTLTNDLTTTDKYDTTTDISTTEEASTIETTTLEVDDRIDPKVINTLLG